MKMHMKNSVHRYDINSFTNVVNIRSVSVWWCLYVLTKYDDAYMY